MLFGSINKGIEAYKAAQGAFLVDVRQPEEFASGHIAGAVNLPLSDIEKADFPKDAQLFVYCLRGTRCRRAVGILKNMGYTRVKSIGGIAGYKGEIVK